MVKWILSKIIKIIDDVSKRLGVGVQTLSFSLVLATIFIPSISSIFSSLHMILLFSNDEYFIGKIFFIVTFVFVLVVLIFFALAVNVSPQYVVKGVDLPDASGFDSYVVVNDISGQSEGIVGDEDMDFCDECDVHVPSSAYHCMRCDRCVIGYDHHCLMLVNCVGDRNYRFFYSFSLILFLFLLFCLSMDMWNIAISIVYIYQQYEPEDGNHFLSLLSITFMISKVLTIPVILGGLIFDGIVLYLRTRELFTDRIFLKGKKEKYHCKFLFKNVYKLFLRKIDKSVYFPKPVVDQNQLLYHELTQSYEDSEMSGYTSTSEDYFSGESFGSNRN